MRLALVSKNNATTELQALRKRAEDLRPLFDEIGMASAENTRARMQAGEDPDGTPWQISARVKAFGGKTMIDKGHLERDINHQLIEDGVYVGTSYGWVVVHQEGRTIKAKNKPYLMFSVGGGFRKAKSVTMPERVIFGVSVKDKADFERLISEHLEGVA